MKEWKVYPGKVPSLLHIVTRAKRDCTAYERPGAYKDRGRRPAHRSKIESMFREMEHGFGEFCYRFWSKAVPKLDRYHRKTTVDSLELVKDEQKRTKILKTPKAIEGYVLFSSITMGIIQILHQYAQ